MHIRHSNHGDVHRYECWDDYGCSVVGRAIIRERDEHAYLQDINVGSSYRGQGTGTELLEQITTDFEHKPIAAEVFKDRVPWYRAHGFEPVGKTNNLVEIIRFP